MRLVSEGVLAAVAEAFEARKQGLTNYRLELLDDQLAGWCLRNYIVLTEFPDLLNSDVSEEVLHWSRYYWLARYARVWNTVDPAGYDPAVEVQLVNIIEEVAVCDDETWPLEEVIAAADRDAVRQLQAAGIGESRPA